MPDQHIPQQTIQKVLRLKDSILSMKTPPRLKGYQSGWDAMAASLWVLKRYGIMSHRGVKRYIKRVFRKTWTRGELDPILCFLKDAGAIRRIPVMRRLQIGRIYSI